MLKNPDSSGFFNFHHHDRLSFSIKFGTLGATHWIGDTAMSHTSLHRPVWLSPLGILPRWSWPLLTVMAGLLVMATAYWVHPFATDPNSNWARLYQRSLAWGTIGDNAPLSHFPLATSLGYLAAVGVTRLPLQRQRLARWWRLDHSVLFALFSLLGGALLASMFINLPVLHGHFLSLNMHPTGPLNTLLMQSLQHRPTLMLLCMGLYVLSVLVSSAVVLGPCLHYWAERGENE
jgi:hypothetical protein